MTIDRISLADLYITKEKQLPQLYAHPRDVTGHGFIPCQAGARKIIQSCGALMCARRKKCHPGAAKGQQFTFSFRDSCETNGLEEGHSYCDCSNWRLTRMGAGADNQNCVVSCCFLLRDSYGLVLNGRVKFTSHFSVEDFFHKMTDWKAVSAEIPLHYILCLGSQFIPRNTLTPFTDLFPQLTESSLLFWKGCRKKAQLDNLCLAFLGKLFFFWSPVKRKQKTKQNKQKKPTLQIQHIFSSQRV